ncbi:MAG: DMT family transporter [Acutalibacteraceae bacterium]|nr:DMT family transporter [Acutalibacteraceae bacterium]
MKDKKKGILFILGAAFFFALMNLFVKLGGDVPTMQKAFFRNAVAAIAALFVVMKNNGCLKSAKGNITDLVLRSSFGLFGIICNFYAIDRLNISDASLLNKLSPFFAVIFSIFILHEIASKREWMYVIVAFIGALFVIKPTFSMEIIPAIAGTIGGMCAGLAYTFVRKMTKNGVEGPVIVLFFSAFSSIVLLPNLILNFSPMSIEQTLSLIMAGVSAAGGQFCITAAYKNAPAKEISVFDYTQVVIAAVLGFLFLDQIPDILSFLGYAIILTVAVLKWRYNLKNEVPCR